MKLVMSFISSLYFLNFLPPTETISLLCELLIHCHSNWNYCDKSTKNMQHWVLAWGRVSQTSDPLQDFSKMGRIRKRNVCIKRVIIFFPSAETENSFGAA
jgi:hypothetical protein